MLSDSPLVAFVATADPHRSVGFYRDVLGLELLQESSFATVFRAGQTSLRVTTVERVDPAPYTVLGWSVEDVQSTVDALCKRGVSFERYDGVEQDGRGIWRSPSGARVAWFKDPDGNVLSVTQM